MLKNADKVYKIVTQIPTGKVLTYKRVSELSEVNSPRLVGHILHQNPDLTHCPCWRVVNSEGLLAKNYAFGGLKGQEELLKSEGVKVINGRIELKKYFDKESDRYHF